VFQRQGDERGGDGPAGRGTSGAGTHPGRAGHHPAAYGSTCAGRLEPGRARGVAGDVLVTRDRGYPPQGGTVSTWTRRCSRTASRPGGARWKRAGTPKRGPQTLRQALIRARPGASRPGRDHVHPARGSSGLEEPAAGRAGGPDRRRPGAGPINDALTAEPGTAGRRASAAGAAARPPCWRYTAAAEADALAAYRRACDLLATSRIDPGEPLQPARVRPRLRSGAD
jgi:hypothetical protein